MDIGDDQPVFGENTFSLHYRKINNRDLFSSLENSELGIKSSRNYIPLYETYFNLNETNYNSINLNQRFYVSALSGVVDKNNIQAAVVDAFKSTSDSLTIVHKPIFIKFSPLIDPVKYMSGKYVNVNVNSLQLCGKTLEEMNRRRRDMWTASRHERYNDFRIFIMGIKGNNHIFGDGLIYDGCFNNEPQQFRGQTGAQDSIIPMIDIFSGIVDYYPDNKLTEYLLDLRTYRPKCIQNFFVDLRNYYKENPLFKQLTNAKSYEGLVYLLKIVD